MTALRRRGVDSRLVDPTIGGKKPNSLYPKDKTHDRGALLADMDWALGADIIANHSGYDNTPIMQTNQPVVHIAHGRPRSSFLSECKGSTPIYSYWYQKNKDERFKALVTFWPEHKSYLEMMLPDKPVHVVQACVDLDAWTLTGPRGYGFHGKKGRINIVSTDAFRDDIDPFVPLHAAGLFAREVEGVKIHVYAKPKQKTKGWGALLRRIQDDGNLGEVAGWVSGLANVYRAATFMLTANEIDTRSVREAMACGCPVVRITSLDDQWKTRMISALRTTDEDRYIIRKQAEAKFNPAVTAEQFKKVLDGHCLET